MTVLAKLVAKDKDCQQYITYVFECLEDWSKRQSPYIMCTQFPNWETKSINLGDVGYLEFMEIKAGIDKWFDGKNMIPYNYNMVQFIRFVEKPQTKDHTYIM